LSMSASMKASAAESSSSMIAYAPNRSNISTWQQSATRAVRSSFLGLRAWPQGCTDACYDIDQAPHCRRTLTGSSSLCC
jgi:hypothetical protein